MVAGAQTQALDTFSLAAFRTLFSGLDAPDPEALRGVYRAAFTGPGWLRRLAGPALAVGGLGGWWGKVFEPGGAGANLVSRQGQVIRTLPFLVVSRPSGLDGRPATAVCYTRSSPFPWPWMVDELRWLYPSCLLGMTFVDLTGRAGLLRRAAFPFVLYHETPAPA